MTVACHAYAPCTRHAHALCTCLRVHRRLLRRGVRLDGGAGVVGQRESESGAGDKVAPYPWRCRQGVRRSRRHVVIWDSHRTGRHDAGHEASLFKGAPCGSHRRCVPWRGRPSGCVPSSAGAQARADAAHQLRGGWFGFGRKPFFSARPKKAGGGERKIVAAGKARSRAKARRLSLRVLQRPSGHPAPGKTPTELLSIVFLGWPGRRKNILYKLQRVSAERRVDVALPRRARAKIPTFVPYFP